jgi:hypothetical protein
MKRQLISWVLGGMVAMTPLFAQAAWADSLPDLPILNGIELSQSQEAQIDQIRAQTRQQVEGILSPEQRNQFKGTLEQGQGLRQAIAAMNLSPEQKSQLRQVFQSTRTQVSGLLTAQQKQQLMQNVRSQLMQRDR